MSEDKSKEFLVRYYNDLKTTINRLEVLKEYAISKNLNVTDGILEKLSKIRLFLFEISAIELLPDSNEVDMTKLLEQFDEGAPAASETDKTTSDFREIFCLADTLEKELTHITYPATYETIEHSMDPNKIARLRLVKIGTLASALLSLVCAAALSPFIKGSSSVAASLISIPLGLMGSSLYIIFNLTGVIKEKMFNANDVFTYYSRLLIGPILGWLFYYAFCRGADLSRNHALILLPFLAGFSTKLVVGIINKLIKTFEMSVGIEDKGKQLAKRNKDRTVGSK